MPRMLMPLIAALAAPALAAAQTPAGIDGVWINPHHSVAVRTGLCGTRICGWVVWANAEARSDAGESGITQLIGTALLEDYRPSAPGSWSGTVFVPDMHRHFASQIDLISPSQLKIKGCILGGLICKSQTWTRIERVPQ